MKLNFVTVDVFTGTQFAGNPLGVVLNAEGLSGARMQAIAAELAALALGGTILANMFVKLGVTLAYARGKGLAAALALGASMVALTASLVVGWLRL